MGRGPLPAGAAHARPHVGPLLALLFVALWLAATTALRPLALPDEGRYVGVAWEMLRSGHWMVPTLDGLPYFQKPPLFYWITAAAMGVLGKHEYAARVAPFLGAMLMVGSMHRFSLRWCGEGHASRVLVTLATMPMFFAAAQVANTDMLVAGCVTASILAFAHVFLLDDEQGDRRPALLAGFAAAGLGVLAKGLLGLALPAMVLGIWMLLGGRPRRLLRLAWLPGWLLFLAIALPWFAAMQARFPQFAYYFFEVQHVQRFTQQTFNNPQPPWFYPVALVALCLPWTPWLLAGNRTRADEASPTLSRLMWVWLLSVVLFFSIPSSKLLGYVLPALAPLAFLIAQRWRWDPRANAVPRLLVAGTALLAGVSCLVVIGEEAHLASKSTKALAGAVAGHGKDPVVFLRAYYFDLPFYAGLTDDVVVLDDWEAIAKARRDDWHRELLEAGTFAPATGQRRLQALSSFGQPNCPGQSSWVVGDSRLAAQYPVLAPAALVAQHEGVSVWRVRDWTPDPGCPAP